MAQASSNRAHHSSRQARPRQAPTAEAVLAQIFGIAHPTTSKISTDW